MLESQCNVFVRGLFTYNIILEKYKEYDKSMGIRSKIIKDNWMAVLSPSIFCFKGN